MKQNVKSKRRKQPQKKTMKQNINKPTSVVSPTRENFRENPINCEEVPFNSDEEQFSSDEEQFTFNANQLNTRARRHVYARGRSFGPKIVYELKNIRIFFWPVTLDREKFYSFQKQLFH